MNEQEITDKFNTMKDNTQVNDDESQLRFAKMNISAKLCDELMDHYGFLDIVDLNTKCLQILHVFKQIEDDGYKVCIFKTEDDESGKPKVTSSFNMDINSVIQEIRMNELKIPLYNKPEVKLDEDNKL